MANKGAYATYQVAAQGSGYLEGSVPQDFLQITEFLLVIVPDADDADHDVTVTVVNAADGETENIHTVNNAYAGLALTINEVYFLSLLAPTNLAANLAANDVLGITYASGAQNSTVHLLGVRMKYRPRYAEQGGLSPILEEFYTCQVLG